MKERGRGLRLWHCGLGALLLAIDQFSKGQVQQHLPLGYSLPVLGPVMSLTHSHNYGAAMGILPLGGAALALISVALVVGLVIWGVKQATMTPRLATGLVTLLAGAAGNLIDRVRLGYVIDFLDFHVWPVFNVADIAVVAGAALLMIEIVRSSCPAPANPES